MTRSRIEWTDRFWNPIRNSVRVDVAECDSTNLAAPLRWRKPARIFACSMSDLFHESLSDEAIDQVFAVMALASRHTFQVLTKRPDRMRQYLDAGTDNREEAIGAAMRALRPAIAGLLELPLPNVHLGVSVEDQKTADERIPHLLDTPAALRFVSAEPLLESVNLLELLTETHQTIDALNGTIGRSCDIDEHPCLDWVIVGGESGPGARACDIGWIRAIVGQCRDAGVPVFVKQLGARPFQMSASAESVRFDFRLHDRKGGDPEEWPTDLRVRELPRKP